jgi:hypothetical protein
VIATFNIEAQQPAHRKGTLAHRVSVGKGSLVLHTYHNDTDADPSWSNVMPTVNGARDPIHAGFERRNGASTLLAQTGADPLWRGEGQRA